MFGDDACLYTIGKSVSEVPMPLQKCVTNVDEWYVSNLLSVNTTKSFVMMVGSQQAILNKLFMQKPIKINNRRESQDHRECTCCRDVHWCWRAVVACSCI